MINVIKKKLRKMRVEYLILDGGIWKLLVILIRIVRSCGEKRYM